MAHWFLSRTAEQIKAANAECSHGGSVEVEEKESKKRYSSHTKTTKKVMQTTAVGWWGGGWRQDTPSGLGAWAGGSVAGGRGASPDLAYASPVPALSWDFQGPTLHAPALRFTSHATHVYPTELACHVGRRLARTKSATAALRTHLAATRRPRRHFTQTGSSRRRAWRRSAARRAAPSARAC